MATAAAAAAPVSQLLTITDLVSQMVKCLVDAPDKVQIEEKSGERTTVINIMVPRDDVGK